METIRARFQLSFSSPGPGEGFSLDMDTELPGMGITAVFGQSGCGKTTFLRCIAGLQRADRGLLRIGAETWQDEKSFVATHRRPLGYVFQESSLFPHLSALGNLNYALKRAPGGVPGERGKLDHIAELMGLGGLLQRYPAQLSGGERQRVAIARALLIQPRLLLMDEPLASLDTARKREILPYLERLHGEFSLPILYVSHSADEVARLADHLLVMESGRAVAQGSLQQVLARIDLPICLGDGAGVVLQGEVVERDRRWDLARITFPGGALWVRDGGEAVGRQVRLRVLARDISLALSCHEDTSILNRLRVQVVEMAADTDRALMLVRLLAGKSDLVARLTRRSVEQLGLRPGMSVWAQVKSAAIVQ